MSPPKPNTLRDVLVSAWRHDQEQVRDTRVNDSALPPNLEVLCYSCGPVNLAGRPDDLSKHRQQLLESCEQYVLNYLPTHLLRIRDSGVGLVTRANYWEAEKPRVERELREYDPNTFAESRQDNSPANPSRKKWHLRTRDDEIVSVNRDTVRSSHSISGEFLISFSSTSAACSSSPYSHTAGELMSPSLVTSWMSAYPKTPRSGTRNCSTFAKGLGTTTVAMLGPTRAASTRKAVSNSTKPFVQCTGGTVLPLCALFIWPSH